MKSKFIVLDLFCGTKSLEPIAKKFNWDYISVDLLKERNPTINANILDWDYKKYFKNIPSPNYIWASPPCTEYSQLNNAIPNKIPNIAGANKIVEKTIEIIQYLKPKYWCIENPATGKLKNQTFMQPLHFQETTYCKYGKLNRKHTRIWNNIPSWTARPSCLKNSPCQLKADTGKHARFNWKIPYDERIAVPYDLHNEIATVISKI